MNEADEVSCTAVVSGGEAAEMLEAIEESFDLVAMIVDAGIVREVDFVVALGGDHHLGVHAYDAVSQVVVVTGFVGIAYATYARLLLQPIVGNVCTWTGPELRLSGDKALWTLRSTVAKHMIADTPVQRSRPHPCSRSSNVRQTLSL